jgi:recombination protein RecR
MKFVPRSLQALVVELARLPGVGERTALRFAVSLLKGGNHRIQLLQQVLSSVQSEIAHCESCGFWTEQTRCPICEDPQRNDQKLCVVRDSPDVLALEKFRSHPWKYHVLGGLLSPLSGVGPDKLGIASLLTRVRSGQVQELILAFDATVEGDATAYYIKDLLKREAPQVQLSRTALGLPAGSSVEYLDPSTLESALLHRTPLD